MNAPTPCRVTADLRAYEAAQLPEFTDEELADAKDELCWEILEGKTRGGFDLAACLDCEFNSDGYTGTVSDLAALMVGEHGLSGPEQTVATACAVHDLAYRIVAKHLPESAISDRAASIRADREEDAQCSE